jgi:hypothetical protein
MRRGSGFYRRVDIPSEVETLLLPEGGHDQGATCT